MNKVQKIHELLVGVKAGVEAKLQTLKDLPHQSQTITESIRYTEGQLFQINYLQEKFWRIMGEE